MENGVVCGVSMEGAVWGGCMGAVMGGGAVWGGCIGGSMGHVAAERGAVFVLPGCYSSSAGTT